jgi:hypothetical protein
MQSVFSPASRREALGEHSQGGRREGWAKNGFILGAGASGLTPPKVPGTPSRHALSMQNNQPLGKWSILANCVVCVFSHECIDHLPRQRAIL